MLEHGGRLRAAARRYGIPLSDWLDLSTGVNPEGWPVPAVPPEVWVRLPEEDDGLETAASAYYGCDSIFPVAGSQAAIQALPALLHAQRVGVIHPGYAEHAHAWRRAGYKVDGVAPETIARGPGSMPWDVLVAINPNNPTGHRFAPEVLLAWQERLAARGGCLVVDEAYMDPTPEFSLAAYCPRPGLIVLRSLGKFFGLAGIRVGFVLAEPELLERLAALLGPWTVSGPSRWVAREALADSPWQEAVRQRLPENARQLADLLTAAGLTPAGGCALFQWCPGVKAARRQEALARQGILTRRFADPPGLRLGLPGSVSASERLATALLAK
jgi:cobalamin biosynthetic protein CobC